MVIGTQGTVIHLFQTYGDLSDRAALPQLPIPPRLTCIRDGVSSRQHEPKRATILRSSHEEARKQVLMALCATGFMTTALRSSPLGASQPAKTVLGMQGYQAVKMHAMGVKSCRWRHARVRKVSKKLYLWPHSVSCNEPFKSWPVFFLKSTVA